MALCQLRNSRSLALQRCPTGAKDHTPRFPDPSVPTDAGPGAYIPSEFCGGGPAYSIARRSPKSLDAPDSPGPGQYVEVQLSARQGDKGAEEGFSRRNSPRFATGEIFAAIWVWWPQSEDDVVKPSARSRSESCQLAHQDEPQLD